MNKTFSFVAVFAALSMYSANGAAFDFSLPHSTFLSTINDHGHHHGHSNVVINDLIVREMLPGAKSTAGYFTLTNHSDKKIAIKAVNSKAFGKVEIHEHQMKDGMMLMQQVKQPIEIAPHQSVKFTPGGYHLMLFTANKKIRKGTEVALEFKFDNGSTVKQSAKVISVLDQQKQSQNDHSHHHH